MEIGKTQELTLERDSPHGWYLKDNQGEEVLLPKSYCKVDFEVGKKMPVFVYHDSEDRIVCTTEKPLVELEQFAHLEIVDVNKHGAFANWGLFGKQLLIPFAEQAIKLVKGDKPVVYLLLDDLSERLVGSTKIEDFLFLDNITVKENDEVEILPFQESPLGVKVIVNNLFNGLVFKDHIHQRFPIGERTKGFVKKVREDGKLDIVLQQVGIRNRLNADNEKVLQYLQKSGGKSNLHDKSAPEIIKKELGMSKKAFKQAIGNLYKQKKLLILDNGIELVN
jgi:predicted RNA-binding protein (virulence factor B family)